MAYRCELNFQWHIGHEQLFQWHTDKTHFFLFYSPDMWDLDVIGMVENQELYQTFCEISDPWWSCSTVELCGSGTLELFFLESELYQTRQKNTSSCWAYAAVEKINIICGGTSWCWATCMLHAWRT
jgi:hypothetical protein